MQQVDYLVMNSEKGVMKVNETYNKTKNVLHKWWYSPKVKKGYEARWVWYHTILVFELFLIIIIQLLMLAKI